jgi:hypothetical protein
MLGGAPVVRKRSEPSFWIMMRSRSLKPMRVSFVQVSAEFRIVVLYTS